MTRRKIVRAAICLKLTLLLCGCGDNGSGNAGPTPSPQPSSSSYTYQLPEANGDGWRVGSLDEVGLDTNRIELLVKSIDVGASGYENIDSIAIARNGLLVLDPQFTGGLDLRDDQSLNSDPTLHNMQSVTKSFANALVGIAIDHGSIASTQERALAYFPEYTPVDNPDARKNDMTIEHMLTMSTGFRYNEDDILGFITANPTDYVSGLFDLPLDYAPGQVFNYNTMATITLGAILKKTSGKRVGTFLDEQLLAPLGITEWHFMDYPPNSGNLGWGLSLNERDAIKLGQMYLDDGQWNGIQVVPSDWITESWIPRFKVSERTLRNGAVRIHYGYQWWIYELNPGSTEITSYTAVGNGGQFIFVVPSHDLVVMVTGHNYDRSIDQGIELMIDILRSIESG